MPDVANELMYELLKKVHADLGSIKREISDVKREVQAVRTHMIAMQQDTSNIYSMLGGHGERLDRIESRLELTQPAE